MIEPSTIPIILDTDNALGAPRNVSDYFWGGDVDDAFAISFALMASESVESIYSIAGNTNLERCYANTQKLCEVLGAAVPCFTGVSFLDSKSNPPQPKDGCEFLALGPLTNLAHFMDQGFSPARIWMTLGRQKTFGRWPPLFPMEFNATKDLKALKKIFSSGVPKVIVPLDVAWRLKFNPTRENKRNMNSTKAGAYLLKHSRRWLWRSLFLKGRRQFPVWDLVSVMACLHPEVVRIEKGQAFVFANGLVLFDVNGKTGTWHDRKKAEFSCAVEIVTELNAAEIWSLFFKVLAKHHRAQISG